MRDRENAGEWVAPDQESLHHITLAVASDLAKGVNKKTIAKGLVTHEGWPEEAAIGFVDQVEEERTEHERQEQPTPATSSPQVVSRCAMGAIALALVFFSVWVLNLAAAEDAECEASSGWFCWAEFLTFWFVALPAWIIAGLFVLGALLPSGTFRRLVVGFGVGLFAGIVILDAGAVTFAVIGVPDTLWGVLFLAAFAGFFGAFSVAYQRTDR